MEFMNKTQSKAEEAATSNEAPAEIPEIKKQGSATKRTVVAENNWDLKWSNMI